MARKYRVRGTRTFLYWTLGLAILGIWCTVDGWFPPESILEKHPDPSDGFYLFNKVLAVLSLTGAIICGYIHSIVR